MRGDSTTALATHMGYCVVGGEFLLLGARPHAAAYFDCCDYPRGHAGAGGRPPRRPTKNLLKPLPKTVQLSWTTQWRPGRYWLH